MTQSTAVSEPQSARSFRLRPQRALRHNVESAIAEGAAFNLMVGLGETYFPAFILSIGLGQIAAGLISTLPLLAGALLQLVSPIMVARFRSNRKWVLCCATVQALSFLPFIYAGLSGHLSVWAAFLVASLYWGFGMGGSTAWNSWIGTLIPSRIQTVFFTRRTLWTQVTGLAGFLIGGTILHAWSPSLSRPWAFCLLFFMALLCRLFSIRWLYGQTEPVPPACKDKRPILPGEFFKRVRGREQLGKVMSYLLLVQLATQFASPFFTPYMLGELHFTYSSYVLLIAASFLTKIVALPRLGRLAVGQGTRALLWLGGVGIVLLPALWLISANFYYLLLLQVLSGFFWAGYDLASLLLMLEIIPPAERTPLLTGYNCLNASVVALGSLTGGTLLYYFGAGTDAYLVIFSLSAVGRAITLFWLRRISFARSEWVPVVFRPLILRPSFGFQGQPISYSVRFLRRRWRGERE